MLENAKKTLRISSMRERVTPAEWQARIDCAACYRLVAHYDMADMMANHISVRVPGENGAFLINPYGMMYEEMTASALIKVDLDGTILDKPDYGDFDFGINRAGYVIHSAIHGANHEVDCVIHTHTWPGMAVSSLECGLLPMTQTAMRFTNISYHDYEGVVLNTEEQERLIRNLGSNNAMILRNHGLQRAAPAGTLLPRPDRGHVLQHAATPRVAGRAGRHLPELPAECPPPLWRDGVAGPAAHAGPARSQLRGLM
jgi:ribulose-5-phosphate 4-epimerase/fuculose-1-phosphate aldolase